MNVAKQEMSNKILYPLSVLFSVSIIAIAFIYSEGAKEIRKEAAVNQVVNQQGASATSDTVVLPVSWGDLGAQMVQSGVIDTDKFEAIYESRSGLSPEYKNLLYGRQNGQLIINSQNAGYILNLLWALGLGNKNAILEKGEMADLQYGGPQNFASTAGWTLAKGNAMEHYAKHDFVVLTPEEQALVDRVSQNIYRPCCGNSTHFPDCNHGMAMLGLLELMASQGMGESDMYKYALEANKLWFPDTYAAIDQYLQLRGSSLAVADPKEILGQNYSSLAGYQGIIRTLGPLPRSSGSNCGVTGGQPLPAEQNLNGPSCGI